MKKALQVVTLAGLAFGAASAGAQEHDMSGMQGGSPPPDARDPHAYSGGQDFGPLGRPHMGDQHPYGAFLADHLEAAHGRDNSEFVYDLQAWYGGNYNRAVLKAEGDVDGGRLQDARTELLWSHAIASYWDVQAGLRVDHGEASQRNWLAVGVQGLAPYWFEVDVAAYLGEHGRTALRAEAEYELLLTSAMIRSRASKPTCTAGATPPARSAAACRTWWRGCGCVTKSPASSRPTWAWSGRRASAAAPTSPARPASARATRVG